MDKIFKNKKVVVMGLGLNGGGVGVAKFFCKQGAEVLVTDLKTESQLDESIKKLRGLKIKFALGGHKEADFVSADLIVKNPDVPISSPYLEIARKNNVPVETDVSLFFKYSGTFIIGITGTKGKSTTASLIYYILKTKYKRIFLAGNIGVSPLEIMPKVKKGDMAVLELSSFELESLKKSPNIAVITNIFPDHLNRHGNMHEYIESKKIIFKYQNREDVLVLNRDDPVVASFAKEAKSKVYFYSAEKGSPNSSNASAAAAVAKILGVDEKKIEKSINNFKGMPSRQEFVREVKGVKYFNDTTATIPEAVIFALDSFSEKFPNAKIFLICGGVYKGVDYAKMAEKIRQKNVQVVLFPGNGSDKIKESLQDYSKITRASSMQEAVASASKSARKGDVVVLSPAASSFNMFKNEFDRGNQFVKSVKKLSK